MTVPQGAAIFILSLTVVECRSRAVQKDEDRPYEFGFDIQGYQHRHEKKDDNGIIMGEFGFVTGDGVYHITVYATDENGNFKILKMKNIYIGLPNDKATIPTDQLTPMKMKEMISNHLKDKMKEGISGCGGCVVPTKPEITSDKSMLAAASTSSLLQSTKLPTITDSVTESEDISEETDDTPVTAAVTHQEMPLTTVLMPMKETSKPEDEDVPATTAVLKPASDSSTKPPSIPMQTTDSNDKTPPAMKPMLTHEELLKLLYKFNYTLTYHGHREEGNRKGDKTGSYFAYGRDGVGVDVKYTANEFGYQPNVTFDRLTADRTPQGDDEKTLNELRGYEFKWFYSK